MSSFWRQRRARVEEAVKKWIRHELGPIQSDEDAENHATAQQFVLTNLDDHTFVDTNFNQVREETVSIVEKRRLLSDIKSSEYLSNFFALYESLPFEGIDVEPELPFGILKLLFCLADTVEGTAAHIEQCEWELFSRDLQRGKQLVAAKKAAEEEGRVQLLPAAGPTIGEVGDDFAAEPVEDWWDDGGSMDSDNSDWKLSDEDDDESDRDPLPRGEDQKSGEVVEAEILEQGTVGPKTFFGLPSDMLRGTTTFPASQGNDNSSELPVGKLSSATGDVSIPKPRRKEVISEDTLCRLLCYQLLIAADTKDQLIHFRQSSAESIWDYILTETVCMHASGSTYSSGCISEYVSMYKQLCNMAADKVNPFVQRFSRHLKATDVDKNRQGFRATWTSDAHLEDKLHLVPFTRTVESFASAVDVILRRHIVLWAETLLSSASSTSHRNLLTMSGLMHKVAPLNRLLIAVSHLIDSICDSAVAATAAGTDHVSAVVSAHILSVLYNWYCTEYGSSSSAIQVAMMYIFLSTARPYIESLDRWVFDAVLDDTYDEFLVQATAVPRSPMKKKDTEKGTGLPLSDDTTGSSGDSALARIREPTVSYHIRGDSDGAYSWKKCVPSFLVSSAKDILATGESLFMVQSIERASINVEDVPTDQQTRHLIPGLARSSLWSAMLDSLQRLVDAHVDPQHRGGNLGASPFKPVRKNRPTQPLQFETTVVTSAAALTSPTASKSLGSQKSPAFFTPTPSKESVHKLNRVLSTSGSRVQLVRSQSSVNESMAVHVRVDHSAQNASDAPPVGSIRWELPPTENDECARSPSSSAARELFAPGRTQSEAEIVSHSGSVAHSSTTLGRIGLAAMAKYAMEHYSYADVYGDTALGAHLKPDTRDESNAIFEYLRNTTTRKQYITDTTANDTVLGTEKHLYDVISRLQPFIYLIPGPILLQRLLFVHVTSQSQNAQRYLVQQLLHNRCCELLRHFEIVRAVFFMGQGDVHHDFLEHIFKKLFHQSSGTESVAWNQLLYLNDRFHESLHSCGHFDTSSISFSRYRDGVPCVRTLEASGDSGSTLLSVFDNLFIQYSAPEWPVKLVLSHKHLELYNRIYRFLVVIRLAMFALIGIHADGKKAHVGTSAYVKSREEEKKRDGKDVPVSVSQEFWLLRQRLLMFVNTLYTYLAINVLSASHIELEVQLSVATSFEQVQTLHREYLQKLLTQCLLHSRAQFILETVKKVLGLCIEARLLYDRRQLRSVRRGYGTLPLSTEAFSEKVLAASAEFDRCTRALVTILKKVLQGGNNPHLEELYQQLNFNEYYGRF